MQCIDFIQVVSKTKAQIDETPEINFLLLTRWHCLDIY